MEIHIEHLYAIVDDFTREELAWLKEKLTWKSKKVIESLLILDNGRIKFLAGLIPYLGAPFPIKNKNNLNPVPTNTDINILDSNLYNYQIAAVKKMITLRWGLCVMPTGSGKTRCAIALIKYLLADILNRITIITPTVTIATQFTEMLIRLGVRTELMSTLYGNEEYRTTPILIGVVNSLYNALELHNDNPIKHHIKNSIAVISDEAHHSKAVMYYSVINYATNATYCIGITGTPFKNKNPMLDIEDAIILGIYRSIIFKLSHNYLYQHNYIAKPYVHFVQSNELISYAKWSWDKVYTRYVVENHKRNKKAIEIINRFVAKKMLVLVLVQRLAHAERILEALNCKAIVVFGGSIGLEKDENGIIQKIPVNYDAFRESYQNRMWDVAIMSQVGDEGIDLASVDALIMIGAGKSRIKLFQRVGRGMRKKEKNNIVYIIDFWDRNHIYLYQQAKKRKALYTEMDAVFVDFLNI